MNETERLKLLADTEAFCEEIRPTEEMCYLEHRYNDQALVLARKYNLMGIAIDPKYGGRGCDWWTYSKIMARIGREGGGLRTLFSAHSSIGQYPVVRFGNEEQKKKYLTASAKGDMVMAFGLTEPDAGSNPLELTTTYRREGNKYILNGIKYLISNGGIAGAVVVFAYPEASEDRMSAFIVETGGPGFESEDMTAKLGMPTCNTAMFQLTDYAIPVENMLGKEGDGFRIAMETIVSGRLSVASGCVGVIEDCLHEAIQYAKQRSQHGKPIAKHQLIQEHLAEMEMGRQASESIIASAIQAKIASEEKPDSKELAEKADLIVAKAKYFAANAACQAADRAIQVFGGRGYSELFRPARHWQDVRVCRIYEGADEVLKLKIAVNLLGKEYAAFR